MERYFGMDVHGESTTVVVLSAPGKVVRRDRVETNGGALVGYLKGQAGRLHLCLEEGEWSPWLYEILSPHAVEMVAYRPRWRLGPKNGRIDAYALAERLRTGRIGCPVYQAPRRWAQLRESVRVYGKLRQDVMGPSSALRRCSGAEGCPSAAIYDPARREVWLQRLPAAVRPAAELLGDELDGLEPLQT